MTSLVPLFRLLRQSLMTMGVLPLMVLSVVGIALGLVSFKEYRREQSNEYRLLEAHARNSDVQIADALNQIDLELHKMAETHLNTPLDKDDSALDWELQNIPAVQGWWMTDITGRIHASSNVAVVGHDVSKEAYFTAHMRTARAPAMFTSRPEKHIFGATGLTFSLPIISADGQFLGIVGIVTGYQLFQLILAEVTSEDSASMTVIFNRDGDLLFRRSDPEKFVGQNIATSSTVFNDHVAARRAVTRHIGPSAQNGKTRLFLVRDVANTRLSLIVSRQLDEVLKAWCISATIYLLAFILTTAAVIYLTNAAARSKRQVLAEKAFSDQLIATANVMVVGLDATSRITIFNETSERLFGYQRAEVLGRHWFDLVLPPNAPLEVREMAARFKAGGELPRTIEHAVKSKSGQVHIISWQNSLMQSPRVTISFGIDVTERKQMEDELVAARQRAESSNAAKSRFLAAISHDVRQPLHAQALFLDVLSNTGLSARQQELLDSANDTAKSCEDMLNTLLDFSRFEAGIVTPSLQSIPLQPLLNKIEREFGPQADAKGLVYRSRETALVVTSDPMLLELILRNFVSNAIRYTERGGLLITCRQRGTEALLEVWDTGVGISYADQPVVFREFFQVGNPELNSQKGLGLGLAIADVLARALDHRLSLDSKPQRGSVFRLSIPLAGHSTT
jgi:PAS domain S-box-containing protein